MMREVFVWLIPGKTERWTNVLCWDWRNLKIVFGAAMSCHPHHDIRCFRALIPCESSSLSNSYRRLATNLRIQASVGCFPTFSRTDVKTWWFHDTTINKHIFVAGNFWQLWPDQASLAERIVEEYAQEASWKTKKQKPTPQVDVADTWANSLNINTYHPVIWVFSRRLVQLMLNVVEN